VDLRQGVSDDLTGVQWLAGDGATKREEHRESVSGLTGPRAAMWWPSDGGEEVAVEALGAGGAWARREEEWDGERGGGGRRSRCGAHSGSRGDEATGR
jgi:hypothetical protein